VADELQRIPATLDLRSDDSLRWGREFSRVVALFSDLAQLVPLDPLPWSAYSCEIRTRTPEAVLICTGIAVAEGSPGKITITFPASGWGTGDEQLGTHKWDLVGENGAGVPFAVLEGSAEVRTSTTEA